MTAAARARTAALGILTLATAAVAPAGTASAAVPLSCGDTVHQSTVLTSDLTCSSGDGLVIGADGVVLDLGGHTITGPGNWSPGAGVRSARRSDVEIRNGRITGFSQGVVLDESWSSTVTEIAAQGNDIGFDLAGGGGHLLTWNLARSSNRDGIRLGLSRDNLVTRNATIGNTWGISVANSSTDNLVRRNYAEHNRANGIAVFAGAARTTVEHNMVRSSWGNGIQVNGDTTHTRVLTNSARANGGDGIHVAASVATVTGNVAVENADLGIEAAPGVTDGGGNRASGNGNSAQCSGVVCSR